LSQQRHLFQEIWWRWPADTDFPAQLIALRKRLRLKQWEFADQLGVSRSTYKNWEYGHSDPPEKIMHRLRAMGVGHEVGAPLIPASQLLIPITYIGAVSASDKVNWTDPFESETFEFVPPEMGDARGRFCCKVASDSCFDLLWPEDIAVFHRTDIPRLNAIVMFRSFDNRITIKQLKHDGKDYILHPLNPRYEDERAEGSMIGYLVGIVRQIGSKRVTVYDSSGIGP
jgi:SOS-response transcriptional repressor LexA